MKNLTLATFKFIALVLLLMAGNTRLWAVCQNLVVNGGFETSNFTGWVPAHGTNQSTNLREFVVPSEPHTGNYSLILTSNGNQGVASGQVSSAYQQIAVPSYGGTLSFWYDAEIFTAPGQPVTSFVRAVINDVNNNQLAVIYYGNTSTAFNRVSYNLAPFAGQTIRISFEAHLIYAPGQAAGSKADFNIDDVSIDGIIISQTKTHCALPIRDTIGNIVHTQPGVYNDTLWGASVRGCDSVVITTITYTPVVYNQTQFYCREAPISFAAGTHIYTSTGTYRDTIGAGSVNGCDSIIVTALSYYSIPEYYQYFSFCSGGSVTVNGHTYTITNSSAIYRDTLFGASMHGCDSMIITQISASHVPPSPAPVSSFTVNDGDSVNATNFTVADDSLFAKWRGTTDLSGIDLRGARTLPAFRAVNNTNAPIVDTITVSARFRGYAYIAADDAILKFSLVERRFVDTIYLPNGGRGAVQVLKSPNANVAYILSYKYAPGYGNMAKYIYVLDLTSDQIIRMIPYSYSFIGNSNTTLPDFYAGTMTISPDGTYLYIAGNTGFSSGLNLVKLNINTGATAELRPSQLFDSGIHGICISPDGRYLYLARYRDYVVKVDAATMTEISTPYLHNIGGALGLTYVAMSPNGKTLYAGNRLDQLSVISTANDSIIGTINIGGGVGTAVAGMCFTPDSNTVFMMAGIAANDYSMVRKTDLATNLTSPMWSVDQYAWDYRSGNILPNVSVAPDGQEFYVHYTGTDFLKRVSLVGGANGSYGGSPIFGGGRGFGSVGDMMIPGQCASPEITFIITVNPTMRYTQNVTICPGESMTAAGHVHNTTGTYIDTLADGSIYGTDSIITTHLTVLPYPVSYQAISLCGGSLTVGNITHSTSGYFTDTLYAASVNGCDSIVNTNLTINAVVTAPLATPNSQFLCAGVTLPHTVIDYPPSGGFHSIWTGTNAGIGLGAIGYDTVPAFVAVNNGNTLVTDTISLTKAYTGYAYLASISPQRITVVDRLTNTVVDTINGIQGTLGLAVNPDGSRVYVTSQGLNRVTIINGQSNTVMTTVNVGNQPAAVAVNKAGNRVYVANYGAGTISVIDTATNTVVATVPVGTNPAAVAVNPNGKYVYVVNAGSNTMSVISTLSNTVVATLNVGSNPRGVAVNATGNRVYVTNYIAAGKVKIIDASSNTLIDSVTVGNQPRGIAVSFDGTRVYVTNFVSNNVSVINTASNTVIATITVGTSPLAVSVSQDGAKLYVVNSGNSQFSVISTATNTISATVAVPVNNLAIGDFLSGSGCQSTAYKYTITAGPTARSTQQLNLCTGTSITVGTHTYNAAGIYTDTLHNVSAYGCDSIVTTQITMQSPVTSTISSGICAGANYAGHTTTGTFVDVYPNIYGCDSTRTLHLTVLPYITSTVTASVCQGGSYAGHTTTGTYVDHYTAVNGCDSTRTLNLTVNQPTSSVSNIAICQAQLPYTWNGLTFNAAGSQTKMGLTNAAGCDSVATLNLTVNQPTNSVTNLSVCQSALPYVWNGFTFNTAGTQTKTGLTNAAGCDSSATLNLTISQPTVSVTNQTICPAQLPYTWNGLTFTAAGSQTATGFTGANGCDSSATLILLVNNVANSVTNLTICQSALPYVWNSLTFTGAGTQTAGGFINTAGCDSTATLNLTVHGLSASITDLTICATELPYIWNGLNFTAAGSQTATGFTGINGCDSTATLNLAVNAISASTTDLSICASQLPYSWNGLLFTSAGSQTVTGLTNTGGCDSTATLNLTVNTPTSSVTDYTICQSALPYVWNGLTFTLAGSQTATGFTNAAGCDSTATLNLIINAVSASSTDLSICASELPYTWNGLTFTGAGSQTATGFTTALGCDSTATLNLTVNAASASTTHLSICVSELPYLWNGLTFTTAGLQTAAGLINALGCDSTATLNLTVNGVSTSTTELSICASELPYLWNGLTFSAAGSQTATGLTNTLGCDSTATLNLAVTVVPTYSFTDTICMGDAYDFNGQILTLPGIYNDTVVSQNGCDSIVTLNLQINELSIQASTTGALCSAAQDNAAYQWIDCSTGEQIAGADSQSYTATQNGSYACILFEGSCMDTTDCVTVTGLGVDKTESYNFVVYPNPSDGIFNITHNYPGVTQVQLINSLGQIVTTFNSPGSTSQFNIKNQTAGVYQLHVWCGGKKLATRLLVKE